MSEFGHHWWRWSEEDERILREMTAQRVPAAEIAARLGRSRATVYKKRADLGLVGHRELCEFCRGPMSRSTAVGRPPEVCSEHCCRERDWAYEENARVNARPKVCEHCRGPLDPTARSKRYCSRPCSQRAWWERARLDPVVVAARDEAKRRQRGRAVSTSVQ